MLGNMQEQYRSLLNSYVAVWNESGQDKIKQALAGCVTQNVRYCDPFTDETDGVETLAK
jgi:protoheme ferro-lyase